MAVSTNKVFNRIGALLAVGLLGIYFLLDPEQHFFPKCPLLWLTGWKCPGCGSQRAVHQLLHGNIQEALQFNFLFVVALPYVLLGLTLEYTEWGNRQASLRKTWYGYRAALLALLIVLAFGLGRNIWNW